MDDIRQAGAGVVCCETSHKAGDDGGMFHKQDSTWEKRNKFCSAGSQLVVAALMLPKAGGLGVSSSSWVLENQ